MSFTQLFQSAARYGVVTLADVDRCGVPRSTFVERATREAWPPCPYPSTFFLPGRHVDDVSWMVAAVRSVGGPAVVGGDAALYLHGLRDRPPRVTDVWLPLRHRAKTLARRRVRRTGILASEDLTIVDEIPAISPPWAIRDAAGTGDLESLRYLVIDARFRRVAELGALSEVCARDRRFHGRPNLVQVVEELADDGSDSGFELRTRRRLEELGLRPDPGQLTVRTRGRSRRIDIPFAGQNVGVECVGFRYHGDREKLDSDAERWNDLAAAGSFTVLHLTWSMQYGPAWERFVDRLRVTLNRGP